MSDTEDPDAERAQVRRELDPRDVDSSANVHPDDMAVAPSRLFQQAMEQTRMATCLSDPHKPDMPIVYVNQAFIELTGYAREDILGQNCRFLQGKDTDEASVAKIREALTRKEVSVVEVLNYRKDGTPFWNSLHIGPIFDTDGRLTHFYGSQWDVTELVAARRQSEMQAEVTRELQHRTGNLFSVIAAIVRLSGRGETDVDQVIEKISERIIALSKAHIASVATDSLPADVSTLVDTVLEPYRTMRSGRVMLEGGAAEVPGTVATPLGLALHELATNAVKYGALKDARGTVLIDWRIRDEALVLEWIEKGAGEITPPKSGNAGTGTLIIRSAIANVGGTFELDWRPEGLRAEVCVPVTSA